MILSRREKLLIAGLTGLMAVVLLYFVLSQFNGWEHRLARDITRKQALLARATLLTEGLAKFNGPRASKVRRKPLIGHIEQLATRNGLKDRIQLNVVPMDKARRVQGIDVKLDTLSLDEMVKFIHAVETSKPVLVVNQLDISSAFRAKDQLRLSVRILAQN